MDPATWCEAFLAFADAQATYVGTPEDPATEDGLVDAATGLLALGQPLGLAEGGLRSLQQLVDSALAQAGHRTEETSTAAPGPGPDPAALNAYLGASCPA